MVLGLGAVTAAALAGVAAALWVDNPLSELSRQSRGTRVGTDEPTDPRLRLLRPRSDAARMPQRMGLASLGAVMTGFAVRSVAPDLEVVGWLAVPLLALVGVLVLGRLEPAAARQRRERLVMDLPQALELLSACLAAGMPLRQATGAVANACPGPVGDDLGEVLRQVDLGVSDADAWRALRSHPQWGAAAVDLARSVESGTMLVEVLKHHARSARELRRAALEVRAKAVGVRSVLPLMTCFLPAFLLVGVVPTVASAVSNALF